MRSLRPEQIILLVVFILVPLLNLVVLWLRRRLREWEALPSPREEWPPTSMPPRTRLVNPALAEETRYREAPPHRAPAAAQLVHRRMGPLGGRAAVRRVVVAMTILGPCRGLEELPASHPPGQRSLASRRP